MKNSSLDSFKPKRVAALTRTFEDELLVYDSAKNRAHSLNRTAAAVWKLSDGNHSPSQIAAAVSRRFSVHVDESVVLFALDQLARAHLLVEPQTSVKNSSRRAALRTLGKAAVIALPLITSIVAPPPARAASCRHNGSSCGSNAQCCSGVCVPVVGQCLGG
jgi:Coenzyme PQQ synthesis protein D (PqqD)